MCTGGREFSFLTAWRMKLSSLLVLARRLKRQQTEEAVWWVGGIASNSKGFVSETGAVDSLQWWERETPTIFWSSHNALEGPAAGRAAGALPNSDVAGQGALDGASVEGGYDWGWDSSQLGGELSKTLFCLERERSCYATTSTCMRCHFGGEVCLYVSGTVDIYLFRQL